MIPVYRPSFDEAEIDALREVLQSGWVGTGPKVAELERRFAAYLGTPATVAVQSGTAALYLALRVAGVEGAEVITTPMTFVATNHAILANRAVPVFADVEPDTLNIDPADVERKVTPRTRAVVIVHFAGHPCRVREIVEIARARGLVVVEDCAHAVGAEYEQRKVGTFGTYGCFSFQAVKNMTTGDGGMIAVQDEQCLARLRRLTWLGIDRGSWERSGCDRPWEYDVTEVSLKFQMNDIAAAIGLVQLGKLRRHNERRRWLARRYQEAFAGCEKIEPPVEPPYGRSSWHAYVVKLARAEWRDRFLSFLRERGVGATVHYAPTHWFRVYAPYRRSLPVAESLSKRVVTLPLFPDLSEADQDRVVDAVHSFFRDV